MGRRRRPATAIGSNGGAGNGFASTADGGGLGGEVEGLASTWTFRVLVSLLVLVLTVQLFVLEVPPLQQRQQQRYGEESEDDESLLRRGGGDGLQPDRSSSHDSSKPPHLHPPLPYLPPFAPIPDHLAQSTLDGSHPTVAGVAAVLQRFLNDLHESNHRIVEAHPKDADRDVVLNAYYRIARQHLVPLDEAYRGRSIFPIRTDDSIYVSLASFRDHLLGDTLKSAFAMASHPDKLYVGAVVQNCFGFPGDPPCKTGAQVVGKNKKGRDITKVSDAPPDINGVEQFCNDETYRKYCESGQVRALYVHESESLGPAYARYFASKLWGGETYYLQVDSHLQFARRWDEQFVEDIKNAKSYPKAILSAYPPGFGNFDIDNPSPGTRLCHCDFSWSDVEASIIRINTGKSYDASNMPDRPTRVAYVAAGLFFAPAQFIVDVPFDPFLPWAFMGEEIALSIRAYTWGWDAYAPRRNLVVHQYRPGRMGLPKFWGSVGRFFGRPGPSFSNTLQAKVVDRVKCLVGYPEQTRDIIEKRGDGIVLTDLDRYGLGTVRTREEFLELTQIDLIDKKCHRLQWCDDGELE